MAPITPLHPRLALPLEGCSEQRRNSPLLLVQGWEEDCSVLRHNNRHNNNLSKLVRLEVDSSAPLRLPAAGYSERPRNPLVGCLEERRNLLRLVLEVEDCSGTLRVVRRERLGVRIMGVGLEVVLVVVG